ncbi:arsenic transporter [Picrophilus oshimae]|uniref:Arsenite efflux membrane protein ArsB n=1 Tax=Picrophilus torridus (strain ATCC 700027 / DSM 9790 / JCM 10055 / NBRC 100828 / KAW 2/3) TaxID=1122961 RepID=A0A8G2FXV4_PICTO|nr:arsenic transporter [Picrophilus oshimae]SMD31456.1 arsenite efflux membrane protein ArsB [Picrophilus oshimae DSM 9789]
MSILLYPGIIIFVITLFLVLKRPRNLGIGYSALIGAAISLIIGVSTLKDVISVWNIVWNATFTFIAVIIISLILDEAGFFEYIAYRIAIMAKGSVLKLFLFIMLLGSVISAIFANDGTALILTPIVYSILLRFNFSENKIIPFIMATGFIADTSSMPFTVSNLVNLVTAGYFNITFLKYSEIMILPDIVSIIASITVVFLFYRMEFSGNYMMPDIDPSKFIKDGLIFKLAVPLIIILMLFYFLSGFFKIPISFIAMPFAVIFYLLARLGKNIDANYIIKIAPWQIVLFSLGMYIIVFGMGRQGLDNIYTYILEVFNNFPPVFSYLFSGLFFAFNAAFMNNLPSVMLGNLAISGLNNPGLLMYSNVIGNDIGPKFTPIGSLATLLWLYTLERKNAIKISYKYYMKFGIITALPVLSITLVSLYISLII